MSKSLSNIMTVFKVVRIVAKVVGILCVIGAVGCMIGIVTLPIAKALDPAKFDGFAAKFSTVIVDLCACAGTAVFSFLAERYFAKVLKAGTPFTLDGSKDCFRLGLASIIISVAVSIAAGIIAAIVALLSVEGEFDTSMTFSLSTGLFFLFLSMIFKYGAELPSAPAEEPTEEAAKEQPTNKTEAL